VIPEAIKENHVPAADFTSLAPMGKREGGEKKRKKKKGEKKKEKKGAGKRRAMWEDLSADRLCSAPVPAPSFRREGKKRKKKREEGGKRERRGGRKRGCRDLPTAARAIAHHNLSCPCKKKGKKRGKRGKTKDESLRGLNRPGRAHRRDG